MARRISYLALILLASTPFARAESPADVVGWEDLEWGASVSALAKKLGRFPSVVIDDVPETGCDEAYGEPAVEHLELQFEFALFCFRAERLVEVTLVLRSANAKEKTPAKEILARLESQYGPITYAYPEGRISIDPHQPPGAIAPAPKVWQFESSRVWFLDDTQTLVVYESVADSGFDAEIDEFLKAKE